MTDLQTHASDWRIVSVKKPLIWSRTDDEAWLLNPKSRYVLNAAHVAKLSEHLATISDLKNSHLYKPLTLTTALNGTSILVERFRDRGIGDLLFLTGPLSYIHHLTAGSAKIELYALADRGSVLSYHPAINQGTLSGPLYYGNLAHYDFHWLIDSVTEHDQEKDQLNVYDALYRQLGVDPATIDPRFKRPSLVMVPNDFDNLYASFYTIFSERRLDLRTNPYYVVAPLAHASLRLAPYTVWISLIEELAKHRPVVVLGHIRPGGLMPDTDISFGNFYQALNSLGQRVINLVGTTPVRLMMAYIAKSFATICLDSAPLYVAQALRVPAVSLWGTHHPGVRLGYDSEYMETAVWNYPACRHSPCYAHAAFPADLCPRGADQRVCEVLGSTTVPSIMAALQRIEERRGKQLTSFKPSDTTLPVL